MISLLIVSAQLVGEADIVVFDAFKHHVETSRADHPFQPVVAIFALDSPLFTAPATCPIAFSDPAAACAAFCTDGHVFARSSHWPSAEWIMGRMPMRPAGPGEGHDEGTMAAVFHCT